MSKSAFILRGPKKKSIYEYKKKSFAISSQSVRRFMNSLNVREKKNIFFDEF
jgi:hypothetical protein